MYPDGRMGRQSLAGGRLERTCAPARRSWPTNSGWCPLGFHPLAGGTLPCHSALPPGRREPHPLLVSGDRGHRPSAVAVAPATSRDPNWCGGGASCRPGPWPTPPSGPTSPAEGTCLGQRPQGAGRQWLPDPPAGAAPATRSGPAALEAHDGVAGKFALMGDPIGSAIASTRRLHRPRGSRCAQVF